MYAHHPVLREMDVHSPVPDRYIGIHGKLYDLQNFRHPGGDTFIRLAQGMDATALFESHHLSDRATKLLETLPVQGTYQPAHRYDYTAYTHLKRAVRDTLRPPRRSATAPCVLLMAVVALHALCLACEGRALLVASVVNALLSAVFLGYGHNGVHTLHWSAVGLDWNGLSATEWVLEHINSHHMFTNTIYDHDAVSIEPFVAFWRARRTFGPVTQVIFLHGAFALAEVLIFATSLRHNIRWRTSRADPAWLQLAPLLFPLRLATSWYARGVEGLAILLATCLVSSYYFTFIAHLNHCTAETLRGAAECFMTHQLQTTVNIQTGSKKSHPLLFGFNNQVLHHLFPTLEHSVLHHVMPLVAGSRSRSAPTLAVEMHRNLLSEKND